MAAAAPIVAAVIGAGATIYSSERQASMAKSAEKKRQEAQYKLSQEQERQAQSMKLEEEKESSLARKKTAASVKGGRADTILTSPLGVVENEKSAAKTLLGA